MTKKSNLENLGGWGAETPQMWMHSSQILSFLCYVIQQKIKNLQFKKFWGGILGSYAFNA